MLLGQKKKVCSRIKEKWQQTELVRNLAFFFFLSFFSFSFSSCLHHASSIYTVAQKERIFFFK